MIGLKDEDMNYTFTYTNDLTKVRETIPRLNRINGHSILITGTTGLVCSAIVDFLLNLNDTQNSNVTIYVAVRSFEKVEKRFGNRIKRADIIFVEYDALNDIDWNFHVDYIIYGASPANPALYIKQPVETMLINFLGMNNILNYAKRYEVKRVLFVSSSEVYGKKEDSKSYTDSEYGYIDILNSRACYPIAKRACETLCAAYRVEFNVESVVVRPGHVYGPTATREDTRASSQFFYHVLDGHDIVMKSAGTQLRSYCYVADCTSAILTVLLNGDAGSAYNISNPASVVTIRELAEQIAESSKRRVVFVEPSDEEQRSYNLMDNSSLDSSKLIDLGWKAMFSLKEGVEHTLKILLGDSVYKYEKLI